MNKIRIGQIKFLIAVSFLLFFLATIWSGKIAFTQNIQNEKPVEQVRKNIQVLKGMPDSQLLSVMHQMRTALGVRCDSCHIAENGKYWMDDKPEKQTARRMLRMTMEINRANFDGKPVVTCNTCHRGQTEPVAVPSIGQGAFENTTSIDETAKSSDPALPSADQIFDKYIQAIGGRALIENVKTRYSKLELLRPKLVNSGTPKAAVINRGETWTIETYQKAPDKYLAVITTPQGIITQSYNGASGWMKTPDGKTREMTTAEIERNKRDFDLYAELKLKDSFVSMTVTGKERIGERETFVIEGRRAKDNKLEKLFFDVSSGLLMRCTVFTETVLGLDPEQTDFEDYRNTSNDLKMPFTVRVSYLDDNHYGTTRRFAVLKNNIAIGDDKFDSTIRQK